MVTDATLAQLSDQLFSGALVAYSLAVVLLAGDLAFGREARRTQRERTLVTAGAPGTVTETPDGPLTVSDDPHDDLSDAERRRRRGEFGRRFGLWGVGVTAVGLLVQLTSLVLRGLSVDRLPWGNMFEFASVIGLVAVTVSLALLGRKPERRFLGLFVLVPVVIILALAGLGLYTEAKPVVAALRSYWLAIHVTLASISTGILLVSFVASILFLVRSRHERKEAEAGHYLPSRVAGHLPAAVALDRLAARTMVWAFPLWTVAIITGAVWAEAAWGRYWGWDPKETWAFISWVVYAGYLHARATAGWRGTRAAWINILGGATMLFNFVVINTVVSGLHSYSGLN